MSRRTHVEDNHRHSRAYLREQRDRIIRKRVRRSKQEIHPDPAVVNLDYENGLAEELDGCAEVHDRIGPVVAVHPDDVRKAHPNTEKLWPFNQEWGRFAGHIFNRKALGTTADNEATKAGWRARQNRQWRKQIDRDGDLDELEAEITS